MATNVRYFAVFGSDDGYGWSEMHCKASGADPANLQPLLADFKALIEQFRVPLLASDRYLMGIKVAYGNRKTGIHSSPFVYDPPKYPSNKEDGAAPNLAVKLRMGENGNQHFSDIYLRGFWDVCESNERLDFSTQKAQTWKHTCEQYVAALVARGYGWEGTTEVGTRRGTVDTYTLQPTGVVRFLITKTSGPAIGAVGTLYSMRVSGLNKGNSLLNDTHIVKVVDAGTLETVVPTAALVWQSAGNFVITGRDFYAYTGLQYMRLGKRKPGRLSYRSPGRLAARAKG
jgi:hypothetical protein